MPDALLSEHSPCRLLCCLQKRGQLQALDEALPLEILVCAPVVDIALSVLKLLLHLCLEPSQLSFLHKQQVPSVHMSNWLRISSAWRCQQAWPYCVECKS